MGLQDNLKQLTQPNTMKTIKQTITDEATGQNVELEAICISREAFANLKRVCKDTEDSSFRLNIAEPEYNEQSPEGWYALVGENARSQGDWANTWEKKLLTGILMACQPSLAGSDLWELVHQGVRMADAYVVIDETVEKAPKLDTVEQAKINIENYGLVNKFDSMVELATVANKFFSQTAIAKCFNLSIKYDSDDEKIYIAGRPHMARTDKEDICFCTFALVSLNLDTIARELPIYYDSDKDNYILAS